MSPLVLLALASTAHAESIIEFKTTGPVQISVDGQQATMQGNLRQRVTGLAPGVHNLEVAGVFGKKLFEAEIELPDNTVTYAEWIKGEIRVLKTEWLEAPAEEAEEVAAEEGGDGADLLALPGAIPAGGALPEVAAAAGAPVPGADPAAAAGAAEAAPADVASAADGGAAGGGAGGAPGGGGGGGGLGLGGIGLPGAGLAGAALGGAAGAAGGAASGAGSVAGAGAGAGAAMQAAGPMAAAGAAGGAAPGVGAGLGAAIGAGAAVAAGGIGAAVAGQDGDPPPIEEVAIGSEGDPDAFPVAGVVGIQTATALPTVKPSTLTLEAYDGMRLEVVNNGKKLIVVVEGESFRIQDGSGLNLALSGE